MLFDYLFALSISLEFLPTDRSFFTEITKVAYFITFLSTFKPSEFPWNRFWLAIRDAGLRTRPSRNCCNLNAFCLLSGSVALSKYFLISYEFLPIDGTCLSKIMKVLGEFWAKVAPRAGETLENTRSFVRVGAPKERPRDTQNQTTKIRCSFKVGAKLMRRSLGVLLAPFWIRFGIRVARKSRKRIFYNRV